MCTAEINSTSCHLNNNCTSRYYIFANVFTPKCKIWAKNKCRCVTCIQQNTVDKIRELKKTKIKIQQNNGCVSCITDKNHNRIYTASSSYRLRRHLGNCFLFWFIITQMHNKPFVFYMLPLMNACNAISQRHQSTIYSA